MNDILTFLQEKKYPLLLAVIWILLICLVNPVAEFPLNDDWAYSKSVNILVQEGRIQIADWTSFPLIAQVLWGALFCLPLGFSFTALRISTLTLGFIGILTTYFLLREVKTHPRVSFMGALSLAINPLYFSLSFTFMSDIHFFVIAILSLFYFIRYYHYPLAKYLLLGAFFAIWATLIRQLGLFIPLAFVTATIIGNRKNRKEWLRTGIPFMMALFVYLAYNYWLEKWHGLPIYYYNKNKEWLSALSQGTVTGKNIIKHIAYAGIYLGVLLFPFMAVTWLSWKKLMIRHSKWFLSGALLAFISIILAVMKRKQMPLLENIIYNVGLGPVTLPDVFIRDLPHIPIIDQGWWWVITGTGILVGIFLLVVAGFLLKKMVLDADASESVSRKKSFLFILAFAAIYLFALSVIKLYDRYLLALIPCCMLLLSMDSATDQDGHRFSRQIATLFLLVMGFFSVTGTHDYLAWNKARWEAMDYLMNERKIPIEQIDGGFEVNGWYNYKPGYKGYKGKSWWWVEKDNYLVTLGPVEGYSTIRTFGFYRWLNGRKDTIWILEKKNKE